jgi:tetratricopeptide (TPR) repeat protein
MKRIAVFLIFALFLSALCFQAAAYFQSHTLYGDLKVDEKKFSGIPNMTYTLSLYSMQGGGLVVGRTTVPPNGRYRFFNVPNGDYELAVETGGNEAARIHIILQEKTSTDIRRDIELEWSEDLAGRGAGKAGVAVVVERYARGPENADELEKALKAEAAKDYPGAVVLLNKVVAADPKDFEVWTELGTVLFKQGKLGDAGKAFNRALQLRPAYPLAMLNLGKLQLAQKNNDEAVETLTRLVEAQPQIAEAQFCLGEAYLQVKKGTKAVVCLNEALRLDPVGMADAHLRLAALYNAAGYKDRAAAEYEQFLAKKPDHPEKEKLQKYIRENKKLP